MDKIRVERITHFQKDKNDQPLIGKTGKPYERCILQTEKGSLSGFGSAATHNLKEGDEIELEITSKDYNGKTYLNFKLPDQRVTKFDLLALETRIEALERKVFPTDETFDDMPDDMSGTRGPEAI